MYSPARKYSFATHNTTHGRSTKQGAAACSVARYYYSIHHTRSGLNRSRQEISMSSCNKNSSSSSTDDDNQRCRWPTQHLHACRLRSHNNFICTSTLLLREDLTKRLELARGINKERGPGFGEIPVTNEKRKKDRLRRIGSGSALFKLGADHKINR